MLGDDPNLKISVKTTIKEPDGTPPTPTVTVRFKADTTELLPMLVTDIAKSRTHVYKHTRPNTSYPKNRLVNDLTAQRLTISTISGKPRRNLIVKIARITERRILSKSVTRRPIDREDADTPIICWHIIKRCSREPIGSLTSRGTIDNPT